MCTYFYDEVCEFLDCMEGETVVDCRDVPITSYNQVGEPVVGDLKIWMGSYAWLNT